MNNLDLLRNISDQEWNNLQNSPSPVIYIGTATCGKAAGADQVLSTIQQYLTSHNKEVRIIEVGCVGLCYLEPIVDIQLPGSARVSYGNITGERLMKILTATLENNIHLPQYAIGAFYDTPPDDQPKIPDIWQHPMLKPQTRIVLRNCGIIDPHQLSHYLAKDGFLAFEKALQIGADEILNEIKKSGLRGRGGAGFPTYKKWEICRCMPDQEKYFIINGDEGDPGAFMNRSLLEGDPFAVLEGMLISAYVIGANKGYIYIRAEYPLAIKRLNNAIQRLKQVGLIGENILDSGFNFNVTIYEGAGAFVCGEETALIASIEGKRGMPRPRPPFPAVCGLFGKPTVINNVETVGTIPNIIRNGSSWYLNYGNPENPGTKTFSLAGKVKRTGLIEVPLGTSLRTIIFDIGGGTQKPFKAVQTGGPSGGCLSEQHLDLPVGYESLRSAGSIMGSGGLIVLDNETCIVDLAHYFLKFTQKESCGKCAPCRLGTTHMVHILDRIKTGAGTPTDIDNLVQLSDTIQKTSLCGLGQTAPNPVGTTINYFYQEYFQHIENHFCPAGVCGGLFDLKIIAEKCSGCRVCVTVCPVGAIQGERRRPHLIENDLCTHCKACVNVCRFDAIIPIPVPTSSPTASINLSKSL